MTPTLVTKETFMRGKLRSSGGRGLKISDVVASPAVAYREFRPLPALSDVVVCTWERQVPRSGAPSAQRVLPDACVDLVWRGGDLWTAGPDTQAVMSPLSEGEVITGIRLRPGAAGTLLGLPARELRDTRVPIDVLWGGRGRELAERLGDAADAGARRALLERALLRRRSDAARADTLVAHAIRLLGRPGSRVDALAYDLAISERQLLRRFDAAVGYGPKVADRVLRFQRFLGLAAEADGFARLAAELGYADQAHLTRECAELAGLTPAQLIRTLR
jgi:AraC-like DNA-binding protein